MSTKKHSERFDTVDWDDITSKVHDGPVTTIRGAVVAVGLVFALLLYDAVVVPEGTATFEAIGVGHNMLPVHWTLALCYVVFLFFAVIPVVKSPGRLSINYKGLVVVAGSLLALLTYDVFFTNGAATFAAIGWEFDVSEIDWLFAFSLAVFGFYAVLPLYQNARMTKYYWKEFKKNRPALVSLGFLIAIFVIGLVGPLVMKYPEASFVMKYQPPVFTQISMNYPLDCVGTMSNGMCQGTMEHPFGTTRQGRDILTMIVYGMQISMKIAFVTTLIVITIGTAVGTVAAYSGGTVDEVLMRFTDIIQSFPTFIMFLLILYTYGGGLALFIILFALFSWGGTARYVRSNALAKTEEEYVKAAQLSGAKLGRIIRSHIVPNSASSIITDLTLLVPGFLLAEAQLAFLGLGNSDLPSWGQLISVGRNDLSFAPWITLAPGIVLFLTILAFNFLGDAVLDALNPEAQAEAES